MSRPQIAGQRTAPGADAAAPQLRPVVFPWPIFGWEYTEANLGHAKPWEQALNRLGLEGWELVATIHDEASEGKKYSARLLFKRPRTDLPNDEELRDLGFKNPQDFTLWLQAARAAYVALLAGQQAQAEGRVTRGRENPPDEAEDADDEE